jgi:dimethylglycine dehydrogenase
MDVARFGDFANAAYVRSKTRENYQRRFMLPCWNEELPAARPLRTSPIYDRLAAAGAVFGVSAAHEIPLWFAGSRAAAHETPSFHRSTAFAPVAEECRTVREAVGIRETSSYCKLEISGRGVAAWLDGVLANRLPSDTGRIALSPLLTPNGRLLGEVTVARIEPARFLLFGSPSADSSLPFLHSRPLIVGLANTLVLRVSFSGELGYEIYMPPDEQRHVFETLSGAGAPLGLRNFGLRVLNALRLEKGYGAWGREYSTDVTPDEAGLSRFVRIDKGPFVGREAVIEARSRPAKRRLALLAIDSSDPDPVGGEPVFLAGEPVARLTSAAFVPGVGKALGFAYLPSELETDADLSVQVLSQRLSARTLAEAPYDPLGARLRG